MRLNLGNRTRGAEVDIRDFSAHVWVLHTIIPHRLTRAAEGCHEEGSGNRHGVSQVVAR